MICSMKKIVGIGLDHLHQLQRRIFPLDALRRRLVKRAVDDVRPTHERPIGVASNPNCELATPAMNSVHDFLLASRNLRPDVSA